MLDWVMIVLRDGYNSALEPWLAHLYEDIGVEQPQSNYIDIFYLTSLQKLLFRHTIVL